MEDDAYWSIKEDKTVKAIQKPINNVTIFEDDQTRSEHIMKNNFHSLHPPKVSPATPTFSDDTATFQQPVSQPIPNNEHILAVQKEHSDLLAV